VHHRKVSAIECRALAAALLVATACSGGGKDKSDPTSPGNTQGTVNGGWSGTTSQGRSIDFLVSDGKVAITAISTNVTAGTCTSTFTTIISALYRQTTYPVSNGQFTVAATTSAGTRTINGTLNVSGSGTGTLDVFDNKCATSMNGTWTATKAASPLISLSGTWNASFISSAQPIAVNGTMILTQSGSTVTGTYTTVSGGVGTVSGSVFGRMFLFSLNQTTQACTGSFSGHGTLMPSPETMVYYYTGSDCLGTHNQGAGSATK
jgi:hypothetical protein